MSASVAPCSRILRFDRPAMRSTSETSTTSVPTCAAIPSTSSPEAAAGWPEAAGAETAPPLFGAGVVSLWNSCGAPEMRTRVPARGRPRSRSASGSSSRSSAIPPMHRGLAKTRELNGRAPLRRPESARRERAAEIPPARAAGRDGSCARRLHWPRPVRAPRLLRTRQDPRRAVRSERDDARLFARDVAAGVAARHPDPRARASARAHSTDSSTLPTGRSLAPSGSAASGAAPATDPFTGAAAHEIAIELPPGTGGMTPQLALRYASQARGDSWVGSGWSLGFPAITRSLEPARRTTTTRPTSSNSPAQELIAESANPALPRRYHTLRESFVRIVHEANGSWTVTRKDGVAMRFGVTAQARIANGAGQVFQWLLEEQEDRHGNAFAANYDRRDPGTAYLATVRYTLRRRAGGSLQSLDRLTRRIAASSSRSRRAATSPRAVAPASSSRIAHRLDYVDVKVGTTLMRRYDLRYVQSADSFRSLLTPVALYGNDAASASPTAPFVTSFAYHSNVAAGTTGWQLANWSWPAWTYAGRRESPGQGRAARRRGRRRATRSREGARDAKQSRSEGRDFSLGSDSGVFLNSRRRLRRDAEPLHPLPSFAGPNGQIPFSLAWQYGGASRTTGLDILDVTGDGRADLVGGVRDLDATSGVRALYGMPAWYRGTATWLRRRHRRRRRPRRRALGHEPLGHRRHLRSATHARHEFGQRALRDLTATGCPNSSCAAPSIARRRSAARRRSRPRAGTAPTSAHQLLLRESRRAALRARARHGLRRASAASRR